MDRSGKYRNDSSSDHWMQTHAALQMVQRKEQDRISDKTDVEISSENAGINKTLAELLLELLAATAEQDISSLSALIVARANAAFRVDVIGENNLKAAFFRGEIDKLGINPTKGK